MRAVGKFIWRFMVIFSFIVNLILVVVLIGLVLFIFNIKNDIAQPLINGLHSSFVGLDQATIDWTIPVRDRIPVVLNIPLKTETTVVLTEAVPLTVNALIDLPGINAYNVTATVELQLPAGLSLPVALDLNVPVDEELDVALDVRAVIPLSQTQLHDVADNLRLLFEPLAFSLSNLPDNFSEAGDMVGRLLRGEPMNLITDPTAYSQQPWPGYSTTAGLNYELAEIPFPPCNVPMDTGIVPLGGIPLLDEQLRPQLYVDDSTPSEVNAVAVTNFEAQRAAFEGECARQVDSQVVVPGDGSTGGATIPGDTPGDMGIVPTPTGGG
jgi:hypothetical protein